jgi:FKBP-type peptidyl-prolyl cis-trans isomerase 2
MPPIKKGDTVTVNYKGTLENGDVFDESKDHGPIEFKVGDHEVVPGFENAVLGKEIGDEFTVKIQPAEAYGEIDPENTQEFKKSDLKLESYEVGMQLLFEHQHGDHSHRIPGEIVEVKEKAVIIDFNHPLAGEVLNFWMKIEDEK